MNPIIFTVISLVLLIAGLAIGYFFHRYQADIALKNQQDKAENILKGASEQARLIESQARENAVKIVQAAEAEIKERRICRLSYARGMFRLSPTRADNGKVLGTVPSSARVGAPLHLTSPSPIVLHGVVPENLDPPAGWLSLASHSRRLRGFR